MKYNIRINQKAIVEHFPNLDLKDACLISFFKDFSNSTRIKKKLIDGIVYFRFDYDHIIQEMPLLGIQSEDGIYRRIKKLCDAGVMKSCPENMGRGKSYFGFAEGYDLLISDSRKSDENPSKVGQQSEINDEKSDDRPSLGENTNYSNNPSYEGDHTRAHAHAREEKPKPTVSQPTPDTKPPALKSYEYWVEYFKRYPHFIDGVRSLSKYRGDIAPILEDYLIKLQSESEFYKLRIPRDDQEAQSMAGPIQGMLVRWAKARARKEKEKQPEEIKYRPSPSKFVVSA